MRKKKRRQAPRGYAPVGPKPEFVERINQIDEQLSGTQQLLAAKWAAESPPRIANGVEQPDESGNVHK